MKTKALITAACLVAIPNMANAFTFEILANQIAADIVGSPGNITKTVYVPGYGNVYFSAGSYDVISYSTQGPGTGSMRFDEGETLYIDFMGSPITNLQYGTHGYDGLDTFAYIGATPTYAIVFGGGEAGLTYLSFDAAPVPEPSAAALGIVGTALLVLRRRR